MLESCHPGRVTASYERIGLIPAHFERLVDAVLESPDMQELWRVTDRGMPVFAHTIDVTLLALERFAEWRERHPDMNPRAVVLGALLHDLTKGSSGGKRTLSHSQIMTTRPHLAVDEALTAIETAARRVGARLGTDELTLVGHVVESHHGPWGLIQPRTPEARLVCECDNHSATHNRVAPIDANDILPLLHGGYSYARAGHTLGVGRTVVKDRLQEACRAESVRHWVELVPIWRRAGTVAVGDEERSAQFDRARRVIERARNAGGAIRAGLRAVGCGRDGAGKLAVATGR